MSNGGTWQPNVNPSARKLEVMLLTLVLEADSVELDELCVLMELTLVELALLGLDKLVGLDMLVELWVLILVGLLMLVLDVDIASQVPA